MIQVGIGHKLSCHLSSSNLKGGHLLAVLLLCKRENPWLWISKSLISSASVPHTCRTRSCQIACRPRFCQRNVFHLMWDSTQTDHVSCPCFSTSLSARKSPVAVWQVDGGTRSLWISITFDLLADASSIWIDSNTSMIFIDLPCSSGSSPRVRRLIKIDRRLQRRFMEFQMLSRAGGTVRPWMIEEHLVAAWCCLFDCSNMLELKICMFADDCRRSHRLFVFWHFLLLNAFQVSWDSALKSLDFYSSEPGVDPEEFDRVRGHWLQVSVGALLGRCKSCLDFSRPVPRLHCLSGASFTQVSRASGRREVARLRHTENSGFAQLKSSDI